jgi:hypothetical protein
MGRFRVPLTIARNWPFLAEEMCCQPVAMDLVPFGTLKVLQNIAVPYNGFFERTFREGSVAYFRVPLVCQTKEHKIVIPGTFF